MALVGSKSTGPIIGSSGVAGASRFTRDFLRNVGPGSQGYGSSTSDRSGPGASLTTNSGSSSDTSSVNTAYAQADNAGAIMTTTAGRTEQAAMQVAELANSLQGTAYASRMGAEIGNQYSNSPTAVANNYDLATPGSMPFSSTASSNFSPDLSSMFGNSTSAWGAVGGTVGSAFGGVGSAIGSAIGSVYGGSGGGNCNHSHESMYDWFFNKIDQLYKQINGKDPEKPNKPDDPSKPEAGSENQALSPEVQALKNGVADFVKPYADIGSKIADAVTSPFKDMYDALTGANKADDKKEESASKENTNIEVPKTELAQVGDLTRETQITSPDSALSLFANVDKLVDQTLGKVQDLGKQALEQITGMTESQVEQSQQAQIQQQLEEVSQQEPPPPPPPPPEPEQF